MHLQELFADEAVISLIDIEAKAEAGFFSELDWALSIESLEGSSWDLSVGKDSLGDSFS